MKPRARVGIVYHHVAHYRRPIFDELMASEEYEFVVLAATATRESSLQIVGPELGWPWIRLRNVGHNWLWQRGLLRAAFHEPFVAWIMLGDGKFVTTWLAAIIARLRGKRVLFWTHGWLRQESGMKGFVRNTFYRLAHGLLLYGDRARAIGIAAGWRPEDLYVVYNSLDHRAQLEARARVDPDDGARVRAQLFGDGDVPVAICSARLIPERLHGLLIEAAALLKTQGHPVHLLLIGDGPEKESLERLAREANVDVYFYGPCYDEDRLAELTIASTVTVMPGPIGLTAIQSLAYGTPAISHSDANSQNPEWESILPGLTGDVFEPGSADDLARVIRKWTATPDVAQSTRQACYEIIDRLFNPRFQRGIIESALRGEPAKGPVDC